MPIRQCSNASNAILWPTLEAMQVAPADDQILNQCKLCHLVAKFETNASGVIWWLNFQLMQVVPCCSLPNILQLSPAWQPLTTGSFQVNEWLCVCGTTSVRKCDQHWKTGWLPHLRKISVKMCTWQLYQDTNLWCNDAIGRKLQLKWQLFCALD